MNDILGHNYVRLVEMNDTVMIIVMSIRIKHLRFDGSENESLIMMHELSITHEFFKILSFWNLL